MSHWIINCTFGGLLNRTTSQTYTGSDIQRRNYRFHITRWHLQNQPWFQVSDTFFFGKAWLSAWLKYMGAGGGIQVQLKWGSLQSKCKGKYYSWMQGINMPSPSSSYSMQGLPQPDRYRTGYSIFISASPFHVTKYLVRNQDSRGMSESSV